jgi:hypothetical protein
VHSPVGMREYVCCLLASPPVMSVFGPLTAFCGRGISRVQVEVPRSGLWLTLVVPAHHRPSENTLPRTHEFKCETDHASRSHAPAFHHPGTLTSTACRNSRLRRELLDAVLEAIRARGKSLPNISM